ncbi:salicylate hydroxylase [Cupriavidus sp. UYMMa02A]|nr:salicylate hydroxylase [Cupriavidus sp. UYMMa02A]
MLDSSTYSQLLGLYADYAAALDNGELDRWPEFFLDECVYKVQPRENFDRGFPLATISLESKGMLKDRVFGVRETLFHDPYYQRHVVGAPRVLADDGERLSVEANYAVFRTKQSKLSEVFNTGRYVDLVQRTQKGMKFASRICVFDSEMIPNSIIYPI